MQEKIIKNKVKDTKTLTLQAFLDDFTFNTLKDANKRDVTKLKNAMRKRGWTSPVFTWQKFVVDGTGRRKAVVELLEEGYTFPEGIPYVEVEAKDMAEAKQLALDFSSQHGYITKDSFLEYTADFEVDFETMQIAGFDKDKFIDTNENDDDVPDVATEGTPLTSAGDIYELGAHRVMCGDATKLEDVEKLMNGRKEDIVLDTFLGSGTTLIAAHKLGRVCYGMELDPKYADVIISRYVEFTGNNKIKKNGIDIIWEIKK